MIPMQKCVFSDLRVPLEDSSSKVRRSIKDGGNFKMSVTINGKEYSRRFICCFRSIYQYFEDYVNSFKDQLDLHLVLFDKFEEVAMSGLNWYIFLQYPPPTLKRNVVLLNTEQLSRATNLTRVKNFLDRGLTVIDYSQENLQLLDSGNKILLEHQWKELKRGKAKITHDVVFVGTMSPRRKRILDELTEAGVTVKVVNKWKDQRDLEILTCRLVLNIHYDDDYQVYESLRCDRLAMSGIVVITEPSKKQEVHSITPLLIVETYDNLISKVKDVLSNYQVYKQKISALREQHRPTITKQRLDQVAAVNGLLINIEPVKNKFCFVAIVRDESPVIERCLSSIRNIATSYLICDTGSVDDTIPKIEAYMKEAGIPGEVIQTEWVSYGETKSYMLKQFREHPTVGNARYLFWLDADEVYITNKTDRLSYPTKEDADRLYAVLESRPENMFSTGTVYGELNYPRWQMARNDQLYEWRLPYQEYFTGTKYSLTYELNFIWNLARREGNSSRDPNIARKRVKMGDTWLKTHSDDPKDHDYSRMTFYMAEAYSWLDGPDENGLDYKEKAIQTYKRRLECEGYYQEKYISYLRMAQLLPIPDRPAVYRQAITFIPDRLEAHYELMMLSYNQQNYKEAAEIGAAAPTSRTPPPGSLFTNIGIYDYLFDIHWSVAYHHSGRNKRAVKIAEALLKRGTVPDENNKQLVRNNLGFFRAKIPAWECYPTLLVVDDVDDQQNLKTVLETILECSIAQISVPREKADMGVVVCSGQEASKVRLLEAGSEVSSVVTKNKRVVVFDSLLDCQTGLNIVYFVLD